MIISYKITMKNNKEYITYDDMFKLLYVEYLSAARRALKNYVSIYNYDDSLRESINSRGEELYHALIAILMSRKISEFLDWKPYVKTVNLYMLNNKLKSFLNLHWSDYLSRKSEKKFRTNDHKINVLWHLSERGMMFSKIEHVPKSLRKLTRAFLYIDYYLDKIFEDDYREGIMNIFSCNPNETYASRFYYYGHNSHEPRVEFDNREYQERFSSTYSTTNDSSNDNYIGIYQSGTTPISIVYTIDSSGTSASTTTGPVWRFSS
jgi:hypothetical protein